MTAGATRASLLRRAITVLQKLGGYVALVWPRRDAGVCPAEDPAVGRREGEINPLLGGYPRNHSYRIVQRHLIPGRRLQQRLRVIGRSYPRRLESLLDIGCCRGFFVLQAAEHPACRTSVGIDVHQPFIATAETVRQHLDRANAAFHLASLQDVADRPEVYGGPFQTVLLLGACGTLSPSRYVSSRTAPPRQGPSIIFAGSTGAFPLPSPARNVRWIPIGLPSSPSVTSATIAGQTPPVGCFSPAWKRNVGGRDK